MEVVNDDGCSWINDLTPRNKIEILVILRKFSNIIISLNIIIFDYIVLNVSKNYCLLLNYEYECLNLKKWQKIQKKNYRFRQK